VTLAEFFAEAERRDLRAGDLFPAVIERLASWGDVDALEALQRRSADAPAEAAGGAGGIRVAPGQAVDL
jgi:hypothetical protein